MNGEWESMQMVVTRRESRWRGWLYRNTNLIYCRDLSPTWAMVVGEEGNVFSCLLVDGILT